MRICVTLLFVVFTFNLISQEPVSGRHMVTNYYGIEVGLAYPLLTHNKRFASLVETNINYGVRGGFTWGRIYNSGFSVTLSPSLIYVSVPNTVHRTLYSRPKEFAITYHNVSLAIPALIEKNIFFKGTIGVGLSIVTPIWSAGKFNDSDIDLSFFPFKNDQYPKTDRPYPRLSFLLKATFPLFHTESRQNLISFEYLHYPSNNHETRSYEKLFSMTFIHRVMKTKEKRFKWDRAMIQKE